MPNELGSNAFSRGVARRRYLQLAVSAVIALAVLGLLVALVRPVFAGKHAPSVTRYVSLINQGQLQICRVTPQRVICPPLSSSLSKGYSASKSKSFSPSKSVSTSTSLSPSVRTQ
jgi:hypothetical protein